MFKSLLCIFYIKDKDYDITMDEKNSKKLGWKKDWAALLYLALVLIGFCVTGYDFWKIQHLNFQLYTIVAIGIVLICIGGGLRITSRMTLKKAGFNMVNSYKLQIVGGQRLITTGIYRRIRHPLYLGEMTRNLGLAILFSSLYGLTVMIIANIFLIIRIEIEEKMLIAEFGAEYQEYKKKTKKLIPYLY